MKNLQFTHNHKDNSKILYYKQRLYKLRTIGNEIIHKLLLLNPRIEIFNWTKIKLIYSLIIIKNNKSSTITKIFIKHY